MSTRERVLVQIDMWREDGASHWPWYSLPAEAVGPLADAIQRVLLNHGGTKVVTHPKTFAGKRMRENKSASQMRIEVGHD